MTEAARQKWYLREWRRFRGFTQDKLADAIQVSKGYLSDLEQGKKRYNQDMLERLAEVLGCSPACLLSRDPEATADLFDTWSRIPETSRDQAMRVLRAFTPEPGDQAAAGPHQTERQAEPPARK